MPQETVLSLVKKSAAFFEEKGIDEARRSAEHLLAHAMGQNRLQLFLRFDQPVGEDELIRFRELVRRRLKNEPVQYLVGTTEFYGLEFTLSPAVLIPRPETEHLVEAVIDRYRAAQPHEAAVQPIAPVQHNAGTVQHESIPGLEDQLSEPSEQQPDVGTEIHERIPGPEDQLSEDTWQHTAADPTLPAEASFPNESSLPKAASILDIGTGSGIIAVTLAAQLRDVKVTAMDISEAALDVARANAARHCITDRCRILLQDILKAEPSALGAPFDIVVSNPPYIAQSEIAELQAEIREYEPVEALTDGGDGLAFYRRIAELLPGLLSPGGLLAVEIGFGQAADVQEVFAEAKLQRIELIKDYSGIDRVLLGWKPMS
ncbi:MAG: HemK/PrmC family methyltransferase [Bacteroidota bacterium]